MSSFPGRNSNLEAFFQLIWNLFENLLRLLTILWYWFFHSWKLEDETKMLVSHVPKTPYSNSLLWVITAWCVLKTNTPPPPPLHTPIPPTRSIHPLHPAHLPSPRLLLTQARSALASSVPPPSGCPVAPPTCGTTSARTTTTENHPCPPAVCRLACLVRSHRCLPSFTRRVLSSLSFLRRSPNFMAFIYLLFFPFSP